MLQDHPNSKVRFGQVGLPERIYLEPALRITGDVENALKMFLVENTDLFGLGPRDVGNSLSELSLKPRTHGRPDTLRQHYSFVQTYNGYKVYGQNVNFRLTPQGDLFLVNGELIPDREPVNQIFLEKKDALEAALFYYEPNTEYYRSSAELLIQKMDDYLLYAWMVKLVDLDGTTVLFIDAESSDLLSKSNRRRNIDGNGTVFDWDGTYNPEEAWKENQAVFRDLPEVEHFDTGIFDYRLFHTPATGTGRVNVYNWDNRNASDVFWLGNSGYLLRPRWNFTAAEGTPAVCGTTVEQRRICNNQSYYWVHEIMDLLETNYPAMFDFPFEDPLLIYTNFTSSGFSEDGVAGPPDPFLGSDEGHPTIHFSNYDSTTNCANHPNRYHRCVRTSTIIHEMTHYVQWGLGFILGVDYVATGQWDWANLCERENGHIDEATAKFIAASLWYDITDYDGSGWDFDECDTPLNTSYDEMSFNRSQLAFSSEEKLAVYPYHPLICDAYVPSFENNINAGSDHDAGMPLLQALADIRWGVDVGTYQIPSAGCSLLLATKVEYYVFSALELLEGNSNVSQPEFMENFTVVALVDFLLGNISGCQLTDIGAAAEAHGLDEVLNHEDDCGPIFESFPQTGMSICNDTYPDPEDVYCYHEFNDVWDCTSLNPFCP